MRTRAAVVSGVFTFLAIGGIAAPERVTAQSRDNGVVVHEWGTFTTVAGKDGRAINWLPLSGPSDLPCFVYHYENNSRVKVPPGTNPLTYDQARANLWGKVRMETPVLYFYSAAESTMNVRVQFPRGFITEWYPQATVGQIAISQETIRLGRLESVISWPHVTINPTTSAALPADVRTSHYYEARATDAAPLVVNGEQEKFLFYRGVADFDVPITAEVLSDGRVHIRNLSRDALRSVILFENRNGAIGYRVLGTVPTEARVSAPKTGARFDDLRRELERALVNAGLYEREAAAMVETWRDSWFEEGMRVFYIVPDADVASILPLSVWPTPARVERVFVGRMDVITPAMLQAVGQALTSDSDDVVERFGRLLDPITDRILARGVSMELQRAIARLKQGAFAKYVSAPRTCQ